jgi:hypothetical protein
MLFCLESGRWSWKEWTIVSVTEIRGKGRGEMQRNRMRRTIASRRTMGDVNGLTM